MLIKYLLLRNFKRFPLRDIEVFEHNFTSKILMVTGPNGSGKSSLLNELTPLPSDKNNYNKNGYKEIHIEKNKQLFKLISDFTDGNKYYFYLNNENLNISNNITTQKELVYKYFNITTTIHNILIGAETFTNMSLLNRKKLFNSITHLNIDKIINNYNSIKEELKNNELLLKTNTSLSQAEEQKLINTDHITNLINIQKQTKEYIDTLLNIRTNIYNQQISYDLDNKYSSFKDILNKLNDFITKYYTYITSYPTNEINLYKSKLEIVDYKLNTLYNSLEQKQQEIKILNLNKEYNINNLKEQSLQLTNTRIKLINSLSVIKDINCNIEDIKNSIYKLEASLLDVLRTIPLNENKKYSKEKYENLLQIKNNNLEELDTITKQEITLTKEIEHLIQHNEDIICPACSYKWTPINTSNKIKELKEQVNILLQKKLKLQKTIEETNKLIEETLEYFSIYKQYSNIRNNTYTSIKPFWDIVDAKEYIFISPNDINILVKALINDLICIEEILSIDKKSKELNENIEILSNLKDTNLSILESHILTITDEIYLLQLEKDSIKQHITNNEIANKANSILNTSKMALERSRSDLFDSNVSFTINEILNIIENELSKYKVILIETEKEINNYNNIKYTLNKYKEQINDIQSNIKVLNLILDEISPKNGLIAKSISSFLNIIISNINNIINSVWEYKMILKAINIEDEILNYKFKVEVDDKLEINDISNVSSGMKEIINLSFKIVLYKLLKLDNYPLFLDELASNMDNVHSNKILQFIQNVSSNDKFSQIFIISHKDNMQYLKDLEIIELS